MNRRIVIVLGAVGLVAIAAAPEDCLRQGNAAFDEGDYLRALELYAKAEDATLDPGQVAYNKAAAHYELAKSSRAMENYQLADLHYRQCLEDATGARRARALYGLGNALAQQGHRQHGRVAVESLEAAIQSYHECRVAIDLLGDAERTEAQALIDAMETNRAKIERLLAIKREEAKKDPPPKAEDPDKPDQERPRPPPPGDPNKQPKPENGNREIQPGQRPKNKDQPIETPDRKPGAGNLEPLESPKEIEALDPDRAEQYLEQRVREIRAHMAQRQPAEVIKGKLIRDH